MENGWIHEKTSGTIAACDPYPLVFPTLIRIDLGDKFFKIAFGAVLGELEKLCVLIGGGAELTHEGVARTGTTLDEDGASFQIFDCLDAFGQLGFGLCHCNLRQFLCRVFVCLNRSHRFRHFFVRCLGFGRVGRKGLGRIAA